MGLFKEFFEHDSFTKILNATFLVLIPKKGGVEDKLVGKSLQILAKVLANRLKRVVGKIVSEA